MKAIQTTNNQGGKLSLSAKFSLKNNHYIKLTSSINKTGLLSAFTFILLALTCLFPISKGEQNTEAVTGTAQSSSLTLNVSNSAASVELDVNSNTGTFASSTTDNSAAFSVTTNNFSGYTLSISGSDDEGKLYDSTKQNFLTSLANAISETDFSSTANTNLNGQWGYKPSKFNSVANNNYLPAPTTTASTLDTTSVANPTANNYTISLGLRADYGTAANTYTNAFVITAVPNPIAYVITYDANTTDTVSNMPASQNSTTSATEITLSDKTPAREGYDFKGWCTTAPTTTNPDICTGTTFQPGDIYGIDQTTENITTLYAIWEEQIAGYIQDYTYARCSNEAASKAVKLMDKRDDKVYTARYINGICTMTQNLDFELTTGMTLSPDTTNVTTTRTLGTVGSLTTNDNDGSYNQVRTARNTNITGAGLHYNYAAATAGTIMGDSNTTEATEDICPAGWRLPTGGQNQEQYILNNSYTWQQHNSNYPREFNPVAAGSYSRGSLIISGSGGLWWSSTAYGTGNRCLLRYNTSGSLSSGSIYGRSDGFSVRCVKAKPGVTISFNANGGTGTMDIQKIDAGQSAELVANRFTKTGYAFTGWNTKADGTGTSYADGATYTAPAGVDENTIVVLYAQWLEKPTTMQNATKAQCQAFATAEPLTLRDVRDNKTYTVRYINGVCTMTDNLDFALTSNMTLSSATTNVTADRTLGTVGSLTTNDNDGSYSEARTARSGLDGYGTHYNYCAATAGTICAAKSTNIMVEATEDICPAGWKLPDGHNTGTTGATTLDQYKLAGNTWQSWNTTYKDAFTPIAAGSYYSGSLYYSGEFGVWWSSTADGSDYRRTLYYNADNGLYAGSYYEGLHRRFHGISIRCVTK